MCKTWTLPPPPNQTSASNNTPEHDISEIRPRWLSLHSCRHKNNERPVLFLLLYLLHQSWKGRGDPEECVLSVCGPEVTLPCLHTKALCLQRGQRHLRRTKGAKYEAGVGPSRSYDTDATDIRPREPISESGIKIVKVLAAVRVT